MPLVRRRSTRKDVLSNQMAKKRKTSKPLPLVERTNKLSLEEFISSYVPSEELRFQKPVTITNTTPITIKQQTCVDGDRNSNGSKDQGAAKEEEEVQKQEIESEREKEEPVATATTTTTTTTSITGTSINSYVVDIYTAATIPLADLEACFKLIERTSSDAYKKSSFGWSAAKKFAEMQLPDMKYMILRRETETAAAAAAEEEETRARSSDGSDGVMATMTTTNRKTRRKGQTGDADFLGFLEFMVTYEDGKEVLYCYEIHLVPEVQGQRLGEELMGRFERIGRRIGLEKTMLTVFKSNTRAAVFYDRAGYTEDENSPRPRKLRNGTIKEADYLIMSKSLVGS